MRALWSVSLRSHGRRGGRVAVVVLGIALGVAAVVAVLLVNAAVVAGAERALATRGQAQLVVRALDAGGLDPGAVERARGAEGVVAVRAAFEATTVAWSASGVASLRLVGVDPVDDAAVRTSALLSGRGLDARDGRSLVLGSGLARALGVGAGDALELFAPDGVVDFTVVGIERDGGARAASSLALAPLGVVQRAYADGAARIDGIDVVVRPGSEEAARLALAEAIGPAAVVHRIEEVMGEVIEAERGLRFMVALAAAMAVVAAGCLVMANALAGLDERREALTLLHVLGEPTARLRAWLATEALALGAAGAVFGVPAGLAMAAWWLRNGLEGASASLAALPPAAAPGASTALVNAVLPGVVVALGAALAAAVPVWTSALGGGPVRARARAGGRGGWGRRTTPALLAAGAVLAVGLASAVGSRADAAPAGLGVAVALGALAVASASVPGTLRALCGLGTRWQGAPIWFRLGILQLDRHRWRSASVAVALTVTVAVAVGVTGTVFAFQRSVQAWLDGHAEWDVRVSVGRSPLGAAQPLRSDVVGFVRSLEGVEAAVAERVTSVRLGNDALAMHAFDAGGARPTRALRAVSGAGGAELSAALTRGGTVALSAGVAARLGLGVGDVVALGDPSSPVELEVVAIVDDAGSVARAAFMDRGAWAASFGDDGVDAVWLALREGARLEDVRHAIAERLGAGYRLEVVAAGTARREASTAVADGFARAQVLIAVAVFVALVGAINAGVTAAWSWRRDVVLLRALGAAPGVVIRTLATEAGVTTALGAGLGAIAGTVLSGVLLEGVAALSARVTLWSWPVESYVGVVLVGALAALVAAVPAQAARDAPLADGLRAD